MKLKYVIFDVDGMELPLIFPAYLSHCDVTLTPGRIAISAGYCEIDDTGDWSVSGQSVTLKLDTRPKDVGILNSRFGRNGISELSRVGTK